MVTRWRVWAGWGVALLLVAPTATADIVPPGWSPPPRDAAVLETCLPAYEETSGARGRRIEIRRSWETRSSYEMVSVHPEGAVRSWVMWTRISLDDCYSDLDPSGPGKVTASAAMVLRAGPGRAAVESVTAWSADPRVDARCVEKRLREGWSERITGAAAQLNLEITFSIRCRERTNDVPLPPVDVSGGSGGGGTGSTIGLGPIGRLSSDKPQKPPRTRKPARKK